MTMFKLDLVMAKTNGLFHCMTNGHFSFETVGLSFIYLQAKVAI